MQSGIFSAQLKEYAAKTGLDYVINDDSMSRPFDAPPVIVNYFYHEQIKKSAQKEGTPSAEIFCEKIKDQTISAMDRRGKFLETNYVFPIHAVLGGSGTSRVMRRTHTAEFQD